jgi:hypothetical protein
MAFVFNNEDFRKSMRDEENAWRARRAESLRRQADVMQSMDFDPGPIVVDTKRRRDWYWLEVGVLFFAAAAFAAIYYL